MELENSSTESQPVAPVESADLNAEIAQSTDSQTESNEQGEQKPQAEARPDPVQKRINELTYQRHEAERRANETAFQLQQAALERAELQRKVQEFEALRNMPDPSQYTTPEEYARAHWAQQAQRRQAEDAQFQQQQAQYRQSMAMQQQEVQRLAYVNSQSEALVAQGAAKYPDFEKVITDPKLPPLMGAHPAVLETFFSSDKKAEIAYFLGKNPAEAHKLASLQPVQQIAELGRIEARLSRAQSTNSNPASPLSTVPGTATARGGGLEGLSTAEFIKRRNQMEAKGRGR